MSAIEKLQSGLFNNGLKDEETEEVRKQKAAQKKRDKFIDSILRNEEPNKPYKDLSNRFDAQNITIASPIWGDIVITKDYFLFASFGLDTPKDKYVYVKQ